MNEHTKPSGCRAENDERTTFLVGDIVAVKHPTQPETQTVQLVAFDPCRLAFTARAVNSHGELGPHIDVSANALLCYGRKLDTKIETYIPNDERTVIVQGDYLEDFEG